MLQEFCLYLAPEIIILESHEVYDSLGNGYTYFLYIGISCLYTVIENKDPVAVVFRNHSQRKLCRQQYAGSEGTLCGGVHRCYRGDLKQLQSRIHYGTAQRIIVCRASGRCGYKYAVTAESLDGHPFDRDVQMYGV